MRVRLWYEMCQCKHNHLYCLFLLSRQKGWLNVFNIILLVFSSAGIMGWKLWAEFPLVSCIIISAVQLLKLLQPHLLPSEKQIEHLEKITDFYFDYYNKMEQLWYDLYRGKMSENDMQAKFYKLKNSERDINKLVNNLIKHSNKKLLIKADIETRNYLGRTFN